MRGPAGWAEALAAAGMAILSGCGGDAPLELPPDLQGLRFDTLFEVGAADGEAWEAFGGIWDVEAAPDGRFAVLDLEQPAVHLFDGRGAHVGSVTETGLGPGELDRPSGIAWSGAGAFLVWDPGSSWVSRFAVGDSGVEFADRWRAFAFGETGFCASGDRTYLSYFQDGHVVHEIGPDGTAHSFAPAPHVVGMETLGPELQEIAVEELTPSALLCVSGGVLEVSFVQSRMSLYDWDGGLRWSRELADFTPIVAYTPDGMGLGRRFDETGGSHLLRSVVPWGDGMALVQHEIRTQEESAVDEVEVLESRLIRLEDGTGLDRTRELPLILAAQGTRLYAVRRSPFPQVIVLEPSGRERR